MKRHSIFILAYIVATFLVQGTSHFVLFARHYASISIFNPKPNFLLGLSSMVIQGAILSYVFERSRFDNGKWKDALSFAWLFGAFLVSYIAFAEAGKYIVNNIPTWIAVEVSAGLIQYTLIGICLGFIHRRTADRNAGGQPMRQPKTAL
jgi:hypothetical protein